MILRNKLILSCAALAAVATTAASTTFAWYTSNTEVQAGTITAVTQNSGADLLMIADGLTNKDADGDYISSTAPVDIDKLQWGTSVTQVTYAGTVNTTSGAITAPQLLPLAYNGSNAAADTYTAATPTEDTFGNATYYVLDGENYVKATEFDSTATYYTKSSTLNATGGKLVNLVESYKQTTDAAVVANKTYYTRSGSEGSYTYTKVTSPATASIGTYYEAEMVTPTAESTVEGASYVEFVLYLKNAGTGVKDLNMTISNLTNAKAAANNLPTKSIIDPTNNATYMGRAATDTNYTVNAFEVAALDVEIKRVTDGALVNTLVDETVYSLKSANPSYVMGDNTTAATNGAHLYYNSIMETPLKLTDTYNVNTENFASLTGGAKIKVQLPSAANADNSLQLTFKVFLNGWDKSCFDACQNQTLTFDLAFNV